jgi:hypothetical protein
MIETNFLIIIAIIFISNIITYFISRTHVHSSYIILSKKMDRRLGDIDLIINSLEVKLIQLVSDLKKVEKTETITNDKSIIFQ